MLHSHSLYVKPIICTPPVFYYRPSSISSQLGQPSRAYITRALCLLLCPRPDHYCCRLAVDFFARLRCWPPESFSPFFSQLFPRLIANVRPKLISLIAIALARHWYNVIAQLPSRPRTAPGFSTTQKQQFTGFRQFCRKYPFLIC